MDRPAPGHAKGHGAGKLDEAYDLAHQQFSSLPSRRLTITDVASASARRGPNVGGDRRAIETGSGPIVKTGPGGKANLDHPQDRDHPRSWHRYSAADQGGNVDRTIDRPSIGPNWRRSTSPTKELFGSTSAPNVRHFIRSSNAFYFKGWQRVPCRPGLRRAAPCSRWLLSRRAIPSNAWEAPSRSRQSRLRGERALRVLAEGLRIRRVSRREVSHGARLSHRNILPQIQRLSINAALTKPAIVLRCKHLFRSVTGDCISAGGTKTSVLCRR